MEKFRWNISQGLHEEEQDTRWRRRHGIVCRLKLPGKTLTWCQNDDNDDDDDADAAAADDDDNDEDGEEAE